MVLCGNTPHFYRPIMEPIERLHFIRNNLFMWSKCSGGSLHPHLYEEYKPITSFSKSIFLVCDINCL